MALKYNNLIVIFSILVICTICVKYSIQHKENAHKREKRQFNNFNDFGRRRTGGFGGRVRGSRSPQDFNNQLIFSNNGPGSQGPVPTAGPNNSGNGQLVYINNRPTIATMAPFTMTGTTPSPQFLNCFGSCQTTSEYNPICGSNQQLYMNEQKFNCARRCGADIQIVRRGSCEGLFPMSRG